jgi:hypothetical protein
MITQKFRAINGKVYHLIPECFTLLDCGGGYFYVNEINITRRHNVQNVDPYYEFLGAIIRQEDYGYRAVTNNMCPPADYAESLEGMLFVHVPASMTEWLGYWTGEDWILVQMPHSENIAPGEAPEIVRNKELPPPTKGVSFVLFAEGLNKFYVVQAFNERGTPLFMTLQDVPPDFPFPILPRHIVPQSEEKGFTYAFGNYEWYMVINP